MLTPPACKYTIILTRAPFVCETIRISYHESAIPTNFPARPCINDTFESEKIENINHKKRQIMKKLLAILASTLLVVSAFAYDPNVNEKVLKSFNETFSAAEDIKWEKFETYYTVSFYQSGIQSKVNYDYSGTMLSSLRYYAPQLLPLNIYNRVKKNYSKKEMFGVTEVTFSNEVVYYVKLQDAKSWITLKIDGVGNSEVVENYKKG
jgi:hypothetical protein